jgi:uncharacterized membrane protein (DUF485 family)
MTRYTDDQAQEMGSLPLGIALSLIIVIGFFIFIGLGTFNPAILAAPAVAGHRLSIGLVYGTGLILASALTTIIYAISTNIALQN